MIIGFTGTRRGMTADQKRILEGILVSKYSPIAYLPSEFCHGDCKGADAEAHDIAEKHGYRIHLFPPSIVTQRAWCEAWIREPPQPYSIRNQNIVRHCDILIACPKEFAEQIRSGTWMTVRYAIYKRKPYMIIWPDGKTLIKQGENHGR